MRPGDGLVVRVERVIDGDTLHVWNLSGYRSIPAVRVAMIDAPEKEEPYAQESTDYLTSITLD